MVRTGAASPELIRLIVSYFNELDTDHSGSLTLEEITQKVETDAKKQGEQYKKLINNAITALHQEPPSYNHERRRSSTASDIKYHDLSEDREQKSINEFANDGKVHPMHEERPDMVSPITIPAPGPIGPSPDKKAVSEKKAIKFAKSTKSKKFEFASTANAAVTSATSATKSESSPSPFDDLEMQNIEN